MVDLAGSSSSELAGASQEEPPVGVQPAYRLGCITVDFMLGRSHVLNHCHLLHTPTAAERTASQPAQGCGCCSQEASHCRQR